jgi:hypothetical protein
VAGSATLASLDAYIATGISVATAFGGIALRAYLNRRSAREAVADERAYQERQTPSRPLLGREERAAASPYDAPTEVFAPLDVAAEDLLAALVAFQRRESPQPAIFPTSKESAELSPWDEGLRRCAGSFASAR